MSGPHEWKVCVNSTSVPIVTSIYYAKSSNEDLKKKIRKKQMEIIKTAIQFVNINDTRSKRYPVSNSC